MRPRIWSRKRPDPEKEIPTDPEERGKRLLKALAGDAFHEGSDHEYGFVKVVGSLGGQYTIYFKGFTSNIRGTNHLGYNEVWCGAPHPVDPRDVVRADLTLHSVVPQFVDGKGWFDFGQIPKWDRYLGQYLAIKYDEATFRLRSYYA
jgi:hypothetical protein